MFLKEIEINGFKSFGEHINIEFSPGLTTIVGPNGSGKSNILDAVLWVLGEQSYKNIRAKESADVIFSGGKNKEAMNSAFVSLYIDNTKNLLPIEGDEIKITRKIKSSGENEYLINDKKARLKDISTLFLDTGVGKNAYSVIGQGKVEQIISASPKDVKNIIEEAAGIKKYQSQKKESLKNLENVSVELEKIALILGEIGSQREHIEKQAVKAQEFLSVENQKNILTKKIAIYEKNEYEHLIQDEIQSRDNLESVILDLKNNFNKTNLRLVEIDERKNMLKIDIDEYGQKNRKLKDSIDKKEKEKTKLTERVRNFGRELTEKEEQKSETLIIKENKIKYIDELNIELNNLKSESKVLDSKTKEFENNLKEFTEQKNAFELEFDFNKNKLRDLELSRLKLLNDIENADRRESSITNKIGNLKDEKNEYLADLNKNTQEQDKLKVKYKEKYDFYQDTIQREKFLESEISVISEKMSKNSENLRNFEYNKKRVESKLESLIRLSENNEGFFRGVKEVLNANINGVYGAFINLIDIPQEYQKAISMGIPGNMQDIVVDTSKTAKIAINLLKEKKVGRASFLALDTLKITSNKFPNINLKGVIGYAKDLINYPPKFKIVIDFLLSHLLVVDNIDTALYILKHNLYNGNIVTLSGELISSRGRMSGGENKNSLASQIFERKREIEKLTTENDYLATSIKDANIKNEALNRNLTNFEKEINGIDNIKNQLKNSLMELDSDINSLETRIKKHKNNIKVVDIEIENEFKYIEEFKKQKKSSHTKMEDVELKIKTLQESDENKNKEFKDLLKKIEKLNSEFSDKKIIFLNYQNKIQNLDMTIKKEKFECTELENKIENIIKKIVETEKEKSQTQILIEELIKSLHEETTRYAQDNEKISNKILENENLTDEERNLLKYKQEIDSMILHKDDVLSKSIEKIKKFEEKLQNIQSILQTYLDIEIVDKIENITISKQELSNLTRKLNSFENVNILAIEEFKKLDERYNHMLGEQDDLIKGRNILLDLITEIEEVIHNKFDLAYKNINENFNKMCMEVLNNSIGNLILINPENYDDSGVEIFVKFKNKKRQSLSLLSGGEKSMVAIAFIMAIFMYKPSPFTFLDEIEAALDEKNTLKLIAKLKEFNDKSQFILITHNKNTMRESDSIFGVTMNKEIGISKIVPVNF